MVFVSSKVTTASAFPRLTSALVTPSILVNDLFTEVTQSPHVIPETESVTVLNSAIAEAEKNAAAVKHTASNRDSRFMAVLLVKQRHVVAYRRQGECDGGNDPVYRR